jgi:hypothetical protein
LGKMTPLIPFSLIYNYPTYVPSYSFFEMEILVHCSGVLVFIDFFFYCVLMLICD